MNADEHALSRLGALARRLDGAMAPAAHAAGRERLIDAVAHDPREPARRRRGLTHPAFALAAALVIGVATVVALALLPKSPLAYEVDGADETEGGYVRAEAEATIAFSDGSRAELSAGAAVRVVERGAHGARLLVESGEARFSVEHEADTSWSVDAGPYSVFVTGTRFSVAWDGAQQAIEVTVDEGAVTVRGPLVDGGLVLRPGQTLRAAPGRGELHVASAPKPRASSTPSAPEPAVSSSATASASVAAASAEGPGNAAAPEGGRVSPDAARPRWSQRIARGEFDAVMDEAAALGVDAVLAGYPLDDVLALADAARYRGRSDLAHRVLLQVRARFGGTPAAANAAFLLGRMAEGGAPTSAIGWYDRYLAEAPRGTFAAEALGRKMNAVYRASGRDAARPLAEQYVRLYPRAGYAAVAAEILR